MHDEHKVPAGKPAVGDLDHHEGVPRNIRVARDFLPEPDETLIAVNQAPEEVPVDTEAAREHPFPASPEALHTAAQHAVRAWTGIPGTAPAGVEGQNPRAIAEQALATHRALPPQKFDDPSLDRIPR